MLSIGMLSFLCFLYRVLSINDKKNLKYYDYDSEIAKKIEIYFMCTEAKHYTKYHYIGMLLSVACFITSLVEHLILKSILIFCCFVFILLCSLKFEQVLKVASSNENKCVYLLNHIISLNGNEDYEWKTKPEDASKIHFLYLCCKHDKEMLTYDLIPLLLLAVSLLPI